MAFGNLSTLYLNGPTNASSVGFGTNVRKLGIASDGVADATTTTNHGTGASVAVTANPYGTATTSGNQQNFGFSVAPADMNSAVGAKRFFLAGNHTLTCSGASSAATTSADTTVVLSIYRVGVSPTYTRTLLGSGTSAAYSFGAVSGTYLSISVSVALVQTVLEAGETIQYSLDVVSAGTAVTGRIITLQIGLAASTITFPRMGVLADSSGTASGRGAAAGVTGKVLGTAGSAMAKATVTGVLGAMAATSGASAGRATVTGSGGAVSGFTGTSSGGGVASGIGGRVIGSVGTVVIGPVIRPLFIFED